MITAMPRIAIAVHDFAGAVATFRDRFGMPVVDFSERTAPGLGAHVAMCAPDGGSNIELMAPADPAKPLSIALQRFLDRRGEGLYALMLEAPDPDAEAVGLAERGLDVLPLMAGAGGRDVHPRSTSGVLVRVYPNDSAPTGSGHRSAEPHLSGIARVIVATTDAGAASEAWASGFGLPVDPVAKDDDRGVAVVRCRPPKGGIIELVSVLDPSKPFARAVEQFVAHRGVGMYALALQAPDVETAATVLRAGGRSDDELPEAVVIYGARFLVEPGAR